jgi:predicted transcriptional regulator
MTTLTVRLPDSTAERLKTLARSRGLSLDELMEELSTQAIAAFDAEARFRALASQGDHAAALAVLDRLDSADGESGDRPEPGRMPNLHHPHR